MTKLSRPVSAYVAGICLLGLVFLTVSLVESTATAGFDWYLLGVLGVLAACASLVPLELLFRSSVTLDFPIVFFSLLLLGRPGAVMVGVFAILALSLWQQLPAYKVLFNIGITSCTYFFAGWVFALLQRDFVGFSAVEMIFQSLVAVAVAFAVNSLGVSLVISLSSGPSIVQIWKQNFVWFAPQYLALGMVGGSMAVAFLDFGIKVFVIFLAPFLITCYSFLVYVRQNKSRMSEFAAANDTLNAMNRNLIGALASTIDVKDSNVYGHSAKVAAYAAEIAQEMGLPDNEIDLIRKAGLLHDMGKIGISDDILSKPGALSSDEFARMKQHAKYGAEILRRIPNMRDVAVLIESHHERWDGLGYPAGLKGNRSPIGARIIALADALDTMLTDRSYRRARQWEWAREEIERCGGTQFDPAVVEAFRNLASRRGKDFIQSAGTHTLEEVLDDLLVREPPADHMAPLALRSFSSRNDQRREKGGSGADGSLGAKRSWVWFGLPAKLVVFISSIAGLAAFVLAVTALSIRDSFSPFVILFALITMGTELVPVSLTKAHSKVSVGSAVVLASALLFGPEAASLSAALAGLAALVSSKQRRLERIMFNVSALALCGYLSGSTFRVLGGTIQEVSLQALFLPALAAAAVYYIINLLLVSAVVSLSSGQRILKVFSSNIDWLAASQFGISIVGLGIALVFEGLGIVGLAIFLVPLAMSRYSLQLYLDRTREVRQKNEELEKHLLEMSALHAITNSLGSTLDLSSTLALVTEGITVSMGFSFGLVLTAEADGSLTVDAQKGLEDPARMKELLLQLANVVFRGRTSAVVVGAAGQDDSGLVTDWRLAELGVQTVTFIPLIDNDETFGALCAGSAVPPVKSELQLLQTFATEAAIAISHAQAHARSRAMAVTDFVTSLHNHRYFQERMDFWVSQASAERSSDVLSVALVDLDDFKKVNDTYGHLAGDEVLRQLGKVLPSALRGNDEVFRYAGDEFAIILPETSASFALQVAKRIGAAVADHVFVFEPSEGKEVIIRLTCSIGISTFPFPAPNRDLLVAQADKASYRAKRRGKNKAFHFGDMEQAEAEIAGEPTSTWTLTDLSKI